MAGELVGTATLTAAVVGSGIMATRLTDDLAVALLINAVATVAALGVLITVIGPVSGAHFNPLVTGADLVRRDIAVAEGLGYLAAQVVGAITGAVVANLMFGLPAVTASTHTRAGWGLLLGEVVAAAGLLLAIGALNRTGRGHLGAIVVPAWIGAAYFFTASTSFANPAVTIGRSFTDTFAGIEPGSDAAFIGAQVVGAVAGVALTALLYPRPASTADSLDLPDPVARAQALSPEGPR